VIHTIADLSVTGEVIYDALIARTAQKSGADLLLMLNSGDLIRMSPS